MKNDTLSNWAALAIAVVCAVLFLTWGKPMRITGLFFMSGLAVGALYALGGIGIVVLYRATGVLNFASGAAGAAGVMVAWQLGQWGLPAPIGWIAALAVATLISVLYGRTLAPKLAWREPIVKAVATLGVALIVLGIVNFIWNDDPRSYDLPTDQLAVRILGLRVTGTRILAFVAAVGIVIGISIYLSRTVIGLQMRALANDRDLSDLLGIPILKVETVAWVMAGLIAGFTGLMFGSLIRLDPTLITFLVIPSVAAAIAGKLDDLWLVLFAGLAMGLIESLLTLSPTLKGVRPLAPYVIAALILIWQQRNVRLTFGGQS